ncbi:hypothetical protein BDQ17DRAFT_300543 [Cyathus striatus]|nr:hypothetical protein BDQ17DRAFT_300543 [Cyathus striatus]
MSTIKVAHQPSNAPPGSTFMSGSTSQSNANKTNNGNGHSFPAAPHSPTKDALRPNAHPYAIKTTSTALLSRSNSSPQHNAAVQHHYIPQPPPSPVKDKPENYKYGGGRHRYSRSLTNTDLPRPLPVPIGYPSSSPTYADFASDDFAIGIQQTGGEKDHKRFGTLPTSISSPIPVASIPTELGLPSDPKLWTPSHLATFLATPFGLRGLRDAQEAKSVADFVEDKKVSGRAFLRLNEDDLESIHRVALLGTPV